jgi:putative protease
LLAPAGDWDCVRAAVENGADAIYFGLERFNARMRAKNFTQADLPALMAFLHRRGVRGYVTFNTLVLPRNCQTPPTTCAASSRRASTPPLCRTSVSAA